ncbi:MAG TPA: hypothetical protein DCS93_44445 [Microscillaceae bacterium]|nr:hypothetical protein [Microscillaceae bacterium]
MSKQEPKGSGDNVEGDKIHKQVNVGKDYIENYNALQTPVFDLQILKDYYDELNERNYESIILNDAKGITLKDIYVEPFIDVYRGSLEKGRYQDFTLLKEVFIKITGSFTANEILINILKQSPRFDKLILGDYSVNLKHKRLIFLLGQPGQGKTSCCHHLFYTLTKTENVSSPIIYIRLRDIDNIHQLIINPLDVILEEVQKYQLKTDVFTHKMLANSIIILDGLDELAMSSNLENSYINLFCEKIQSLVDKYYALKVIITSRLHYINLETFNTKRSHTLVLKLRGLSQKKQLEWLNNFDNYYPNQFPKEKLIEYTAVKNNTPKYKYLYELLELPILLYFIAFIEIDLTEYVNRAKVYEIVFDTVLEKAYDDYQQTPHLKGVEKIDFLKALRDIAFEIFKSEYEYIHQSKILELESVKNIPQYQNALESLLVSFYFKKVNKHKTDNGSDDKSRLAIEFLHKSLGEYLTAEKVWDDLLKLSYIVKGQEAFRLLAKIFDTKCFTDEVIGYLIEVLSYKELEDKMRLIQHLINYFPYFVDNDFLLDSCKGDTMLKSLDKSRNFCNNFFAIVSCIDSEKSFFQDIGNVAFDSFVKYTQTVNIINLNLSGQKLIRKDLQDINLSDMNLEKVDFQNSSLVGAVLEKSNLKKSNLGNADLREASLYRSNLERSNLKGANLAFTRLREVNFFKANLDKANLEGADLHNAELWEASLSKAILTEANLWGAHLQGANLVNANLGMANLYRAYLRDANLQGTNLRGAVLNRANLCNAKLRGTSMSQSQYDYAKSQGAILENVKIVPEI